MSVIDVDATSICKLLSLVKIPLGIYTSAPPFLLYVAVIVLGSPSSSTNYEAKLILVLYLCTKFISGRAVGTSLGAVLVIVNLKVVLVDVNGCASLAVSVIV